MSLKTIKNVREEKWAELKSIAAKHRIPMGKLLESMVDTYSKNNEDGWKRILHGRKDLTDAEAEGIREVVAELRKEKWFRE
ncbi:MAG: hypothetical protein HYX24_04060 [Candidatus Aenigmarchaeota archaeon]|nr:hypothetical protein [Candidatus Aenigmarchaeota archaeon]